jgi:enoyl-CoA hydratase/carnithine racemase
VARLAEPTALAEAVAAAGGVAGVIDLTAAPDEGPSEMARQEARTVPGVMVGVLHRRPRPAAIEWGRLTDVILACSDDADSPAASALDAMAVPVGRDLDGALERLTASIAARPKAAAALALLLRGDHRIEDALVAESAVYSMLQAGPEFAAWRAGRPVVGSRVKTADSTPPVTVARDADSMTITLSRPSRHNALNTEMRDGLVEALSLALTDTTANVILQGNGPSFCSGGDLDEFGTAPDPATSHLIRLTRSPAALAARLGPRLVARVHGACIGAGVELPAFAGRVLARSDAFFALPELALGLIPGSGGTVSLPRRIGRYRTAWLALSGERLLAHRAQAWGLVDDIC